MKEHLHPLQVKILKLFNENKNELPSFREIAKRIGVSSTNTVFHHINVLKRRGYLVKSYRPAGIADLTLHSILGLGKPGVYVIFEVQWKKRNPAYIGEADDMRKDLFKILMDEDHALTKKINASFLKFEIAFYSIPDSGKRSETFELLRAQYPNS